jgi:3-methyladenine DNA glycosylase AlkD
VRVPAIRAVANQGDALGIPDVVSLLRSKYHEERLLALLMLVRRFERGEDGQRKRLFQLYLREARWVNNWDLVDLSAPKIVGAWLLDKPRLLLVGLARSPIIWRRRIAIVATSAFIRERQYADTLSLCEMLLPDRHDLIHKACGWMLREVGKRDPATLTGFLDQHAAKMPRTMLRYALERLPPARRQAYLAVRHEL